MLFRSILKDGKPAPIQVALGATDGKFTQVKSGGVAPGAELIVETLRETK